MEVCINEMSRDELIAKLKLKNSRHFAKTYLTPALAMKVIEMTQPDSPRSPTQKYRLTGFGKSLISKGEA